MFQHESNLTAMINDTTKFSLYSNNLGFKSICKLLGFLLITSFSSQGQKPVTKYMGFADANFAVNMDGGHSRFHLGQFNNFITSEYKKFSFLTEVVFENHEGWQFEIMRALLKYEFSPSFSVQLGKYDTPLGYWNNAYHHGAWLEPTIGRPFFLREDHGHALIPVHSNGMVISGVNITKYKLAYSVAIGNGIGAHGSHDNDRYKSITAQVSVKPKKGLVVGVSGYYDHISDGTESLIEDSVLNEDMIQTMGNGFVRYGSKNIEFIGEIYFVRNTMNSGEWLNYAGYFAYLGYTFKGLLTPYLKYDVLAVDQDERYFVNNHKSEISLGCRYDITPTSVIKVAYKYSQCTNMGVNKDLILSWALRF